MKRIGHAQGLESRLRRLAQNISELQKRDEAVLRRASEIADLRSRAAVELHSLCRDFVHSVADLLPDPSLIQLDPSEFPETSFSETSANLFQIAVRGRILQIEFSATAELLSVDDYRVPYTLEGCVRAFNQQMLDREWIDEHQIFYTIEGEASCWTLIDRRTHRPAELDRERLLSLMEMLI